MKLYAAKDVDEDIDTIQLSDPIVETTVEITQATTFDVSYQVKVGYHYEEERAQFEADKTDYFENYVFSK